MILEIVLSIVATAGTYEYANTVVPSVPYWLMFPLLVGIATGVYFLPTMWLVIVSVASAAGFFYGMLSRRHQQVVVQTRRSGLPPLP